MQVLIVDSNPLMRRVVRAFLTQSRYQVCEAADGHAVISALLRDNISLLVCAWPIPNISGADLIRRIRAHPDLAYTYIILVAESRAQTDLLDGVRAGADDYLIKPLNLKELRRRVILGSRMVALKQRLDAVQSERDRLYTHDGLTSLLNRQAMYERTEAKLARATREGKSLSLVLLKVDQFRAVNEQHGFEVGDQTLRFVAKIIGQTIRQHDWVGRWDGTAFLLALPDASIAAADMVAERIRERVAASEIPLLSGTPLKVSMSFGVTSTSINAVLSLPLLIQQANAALSTARQHGGNYVAQFVEGM